MSTTINLAPYAGVKRSTVDGREVFDKLWNMGEPRFEGALEFDGTDDYVDLNNSSVLKPDIITISFWFNYKDDLGTWHWFVGAHDDSNGGGGFTFVKPSSQTNLQFRNNGDNLLLIDSINRNENYYVTATIDPSNNVVRGYVNGQLVDQGTYGSSIPWTSRVISFGRANYYSSPLWEGYITNVQIWNRALTQQEIQDNMYKTLKGDEEGLVAYYPLDSIDNGEVIDLSPNGNNGTVVGNPSVVSPFNPVWSGNDRPEYHRTVDGYDQLCVEKESTNYINYPLSNDNSDGIQIEYLDSQTVKATIIDTTILTAGYKCIFGGNYEAPQGTPTVISGYELEKSTYNLKIGIQGYGAIITRPNYKTDDDGRIWDVIVNDNQVWNHRLNIRVDNPELLEVGDYIIIHKPSIEAGEYPTLFTEGTRLAPSPVIENALPEEGTIAGVVDYVHTTDLTYAIIGNTSDIVTEATRFVFSSSNNIILRVFGNDGGQINEANPLPVGDNTRHKMAYYFTWNDSNLELHILFEDNNIYSFTSTNVNNVTTNRSLTLGQGSVQLQSVYFEKPLYKDSIVRVNATDNEIKEFFEELVKNTSMEMNKSEMKIVS